MSDPRVCHHGGLRRQCEACDLAERLETAVKLLRVLVEDGSPWDRDGMCHYCRHYEHLGPCEWVAARVFVDSEASPARPSGRV